MTWPVAAALSVRVDWMVVATIAGPVIGVFVGIWMDRLFESKPRLITYYGHVSSFRKELTGGANLVVNTHAVVLRNAGRRSATNVRLRHNVLPDFTIWPSLTHHVETLPDGSKEIVIPTLVSGEEITISYMYFPPVTVAQVNSGIKSDQGFA